MRAGWRRPIDNGDFEQSIEWLEWRLGFLETIKAALCPAFLPCSPCVRACIPLDGVQLFFEPLTIPFVRPARCITEAIIDAIIWEMVIRYGDAASKVIDDIPWLPTSWSGTPMYPWSLGAVRDAADSATGTARSVFIALEHACCLAEMCPRAQLPWHWMRLDDVHGGGPDLKARRWRWWEIPAPAEAF